MQPGSRTHSKPVQQLREQITAIAATTSQTLRAGSETSTTPGCNCRISNAGKHWQARLETRVATAWQLREESGKICLQLVIIRKRFHCRLSKSTLPVVRPILLSKDPSTSSDASINTKRTSSRDQIMKHSTQFGNIITTLAGREIPMSYGAANYEPKIASGRGSAPAR